MLTSAFNRADAWLQTLGGAPDSHVLSVPTVVDLDASVAALKDGGLCSRAADVIKNDFSRSRPKPGRRHDGCSARVAQLSAHNLSQGKQMCVVSFYRHLM